MNTPLSAAENYAGQACRRLTLPCGDSVLVALHGAHVLSWTVQGVEQLYLSPRAVLDGQAAIRGGVPICFPQFNQRGPLPKHGFVRNMPWSSAQSPAIGGDAGRLAMRLAANDATRALWPVEFEVFFAVDLQPNTLQMTLTFHNQAPTPVEFSGALHTYLAVDDVANTRLMGLSGRAEWDSLTDVHNNAAETIQFSGEFDRVYSAAPHALTLHGNKRQLRISQSPSWPHTVVWNPGAALCAKMADMPQDGYARMLCVEAAQVMEPIAVAPGAVWQGWQRLVSTIEPC